MSADWPSKPHKCDEGCVCPECGKPLIYAPSTNEHACPDVDCKYGHGLESKIMEEFMSVGPGAHALSRFNVDLIAEEWRRLYEVKPHVHGGPTEQVSPQSSQVQRCACGATRFRNHGPWSPWSEPEVTP